MSESTYRKRKRIMNKIAKIVLLVILLYAVTAVVLGIVNIVGILFGGFSVVNRILEIMAFIVDFIFEKISYVLSYPYVLPVVGTLITGAMIFKITVRGYWVLITRPWIIVTSAATLYVVLWVWNTFHPGFMTYCSFLVTGPFSMVDITLRGFSSLVPETAAQFSSALSYIGHAFSVISPYIYPVTTWFAGLFIMSRLTVMFYSAFSYTEIVDDIHALRIADSVVEEARRRTHRLPKHIFFYLERGEGVNACAFDHNKVAMTADLMECDEEIIRAVIGHELGHIANKDVTANLISGSNVKLICGLFTIPYFLLWGQSDKDNKVEVGPLVFILIFLALFGVIINFFINIAHYVCYIFGGKRCEYKADLFSARLGYGAGLLDFMLGYLDAPSGGLKDPHPSMKNRIIHIAEYIVNHPKKYPAGLVDAAKHLKEDPDGYYNTLISGAQTDIELEPSL